MTAFRDDREAAIARAEALEQELGREKAENERLREELDEARSNVEEERAKTARAERERDKAEKAKAEKDKAEKAKAEKDKAEKAKAEKDKAEKDKAEKDKAEKTKAKPKQGDRPRGAANKRRRLELVPKIFTVGLFVAIGGVLITSFIGACIKERRTKAWEIEKKALEAAIERWTVHRDLPACVRGAEDAIARGAAPEQIDVRSPKLGDLPQLGPRCLTELHKVARDPQLIAHGHLVEWVETGSELARAVEDARQYYANRDFREDDYRAAPAKWARVRTALRAYAPSVASVRRALPEVRAALALQQGDHLARNGRDALWWRLEIGALLEQVLDEVHDLARSGSSPESIAAAARAGLRKIIERSAEAPLEVRRAVRAQHGLEAMLELSDAALAREIHKGRGRWNVYGAPFAPQREAPRGLFGC